MQLYNTAVTEPNYEKFLNNLPSSYQVQDDLIKSDLWQGQIKPVLIKEIRDLQNEIKQLFENPQMENPDLVKVKENYDIFTSHLEQFLNALEDDHSYNEIRANLMNCKFEKNIRKSKSGQRKVLKLTKKVKN